MPGFYIDSLRFLKDFGIFVKVCISNSSQHSSGILTQNYRNIFFRGPSHLRVCQNIKILR
jgi:hypothetical protein